MSIRQIEQAPAIENLWMVLADGLHIQRVHLSLQEWTDLTDAPAFQVAGLSSHHLAVAGAPASTPARELIDAAGLTAWVGLPTTHGKAELDHVNPLATSADAAFEFIAAGLPLGQSTVDAVRALAAASAWWVGFFAIIRHTGVHHQTLTPKLPALDPAALQQATSAVAIGLCTRLLEAHLGTRAADIDSAQIAYCRAVIAAIDLEPKMPTLLEGLGELRLVDLVSTSPAWRGQFTKYAGGTGAGQVE